MVLERKGQTSRALGNAMASKKTTKPAPAVPTPSPPPTAQKKPPMTDARKKALERLSFLNGLLREGVPKPQARKAADAFWEARKAGASEADARKKAEHHHGGTTMANKPSKPKDHDRGETVVPTPTGGDVTSGRPGSLRAFIHAHTVLAYDERELGAIWTGAVDAMRAPTGPNTSSMFPKGEEEPEELASFRALAQEREIGRQLWRALGKVIVHYGITEDEWRAAYQRALRDVYPEGNVIPFAAAPSASSAAAERGAWLSPLTIPSAITDVFNRVREDGTVHKGIDLRAPVGTPIQAPRRGRIVVVDYDKEGGGQFIHMAVERPDGSIPMDKAGVDDTGWRLTFAHLSSVNVKPGDLVEAGQVIGLTGETGYKARGPHLHFSTQWFVDNNLVNDHIFVDPTALIPEDVISGRMRSYKVPATGGLAPALTIPKTGTSAQGQSISVKIGGDGAVMINSKGAAGNVKPQIDLPLPFTGDAETQAASVPTDSGGFGGLVQPVSYTPASNGGGARPGGGLPQPPPIVGEALQGLGQLAGRVFDLVASPQGVRAVLRVAGGIGGLTGAALGAGGTLATTFGSALAAIPYVGPFLAGAAGVAGPIAVVAGPVVSGVSGTVSASADTFAGGGPKQGLDALFGGLPGQPTGQQLPPLPDFFAAFTKPMQGVTPV
jgi:hypothetical protein